jgi:predicted GIY-YIG superfamily endonuclease
MGARNFYVYVLAGRIGGTLYVGMTNDLIRRVAEHRLKQVKSLGWSISSNSRTPKMRFAARND